MEETPTPTRAWCRSRDADAASRYVTRTLINWDRCADKRVSGKSGPDDAVVTWTIGFPTVTDDIPTLLSRQARRWGPFRLRARDDHQLPLRM